MNYKNININDIIDLNKVTLTREELEQLEDNKHIVWWERGQEEQYGNEVEYFTIGLEDDDDISIKIYVK